VTIENDATPHTGDAAPLATGSSGRADADPERVADRVYALLMKELRLEHARSARVRGET
jgi:hypothetical protein